MKYWCYSYDPQKESFIYNEDNTEATLGKTQVLIKPILVGVCGSDLKQILSKSDQPLIGHEWVGLIQEVGSAVTRYKVNEKVISLAHISCGKCEFCKRGEFDHCIDRQLLGSAPKTVLSSSIILEQDDLLKVPQELSFEDIALFEVAFIGDTAYNKALSLGLKAEDHCLVFGAGPIGIFTSLALKLRGYSVTMIEVKKERLELARQLGFDAFHFTKAMLNTKMHNKFDAVFDCSGDNHGSGALQALPAFPKTNGIVVIVGKYSSAKLEESHYAGKSLKVTWVANHEKKIFQETIQFWSAFISNFTSTVSHYYDIQEIDRAFKDALNSKFIKNIIRINKHENS